MASEIPVGTIVPYGGHKQAPQHWMFCRGQAVSRQTFSALYDVLGDAYSPTGKPDPAMISFYLPDLRGRFPLGLNQPPESPGAATRATADHIGGSGGHETYQLKKDELPTHDHSIFLQYGGDAGSRPAKTGPDSSLTWFSANPVGDFEGGGHLDDLYLSPDGENNAHHRIWQR